MTKRIGNFIDNNNKKFKIDHDLNQLWGDDLDTTDVDDCFMLASQAYQQDTFTCTQRNNVSILNVHNGCNDGAREETYTCTQSNVSILPTYSDFKFDRKSTFTSTQVDSIASVPSTSKFKVPSTNGIRKHDASSNDEVLRLQKLCETKDGEVTILRSQLRQIKANTESELAKKEHAWTEKFNATQKEMQVVKSDLEFKNLEIVNLKNKVVEITKHFNAELSSNKINSNDVQVLDALVNPYKVETIVEYEKPLSYAISPAIFNPGKPEIFQTNIKYNTGCKVNQFLQKEDDIVVTELKRINENRRFKVDCIYADINILMQSSANEIDSEKCHSNINRILCVTKHVVQNFRNYLVILERNMQNEDIENLDNLYMKRIAESTDINSSIFDSKEWCDNEIGIKSRQMIAVISEILPHSKYLQGNLLENKSPIYRPDDDAFAFDCRTNNERVEFDFLYLILSVINIIGKIRKADDCVGFLCAVSHFLTKVCLTSHINNCRSLVFSITREIVFARPPGEVLKYLSRLFVKASLNEGFVQDLCKMPVQRSLLVNSKEETLSFNKDSCILQVFTALYEDNFINRCDRKDLDVNLNMLQFIRNILKSNLLWLYYQESNYCECIWKINNLAVEIIYEVLNIYKNESTCKFKKSQNINKCKEILQYSMKLLNILSFKFADLINAKSQYKFIAESSMSLRNELNFLESDLETLEIVHTQEEVPNINDNIFNTVSLWN